MFEPKSKAVYKDIVYKTIGDEKLLLDIYYPINITKEMPVLVYVHGGGFLWYTKDLYNESYRINHVSYKDKLNELGFIFIAIEYRKQKIIGLGYDLLSAQIADVKDGVLWIKEHHNDLKCNPENIGLWGLSAGGALALGAAINNDILYPLVYSTTYTSEVSYVIDYYGITDLENYYNLVEFKNQNKEQQEEINHMLDEHLDINRDEEFREIKVHSKSLLHSPIHNVTRNNLSISIYHGTSDLQVDFVHNAMAFYIKSLHLNNEVKLHQYDGLNHGFWWYEKDFYETLENLFIKEILEYSSRNVTK